MTERRQSCPEKQPAEVVDLDDGPVAFSPGTAGLPSPGLTEGLARLREAGIVVLWVSQADANKVREVADALLLSGLDPTGRDPLLLVRNRNDRKQTLRQEANLDVCVIAIAGDRRGDFDELFDYLRNPDAALGLEGMIGSGWFIAPVPFEQAAPGAP
jgi:predicted secreted acid phosphatase